MSVPANGPRAWLERFPLAPATATHSPRNLFFFAERIKKNQVEIEEAPVPTPAPTAPSGPYLGSAAVVPGTIEVEEFDYGGEGIGYHETSPGNSGGVSLRFENLIVWPNRAVNSAVVSCVRTSLRFGLVLYIGCRRRGRRDASTTFGQGWTGWVAERQEKETAGT